MALHLGLGGIHSASDLPFRIGRRDLEPELCNLGHNPVFPSEPAIAKNLEVSSLCGTRDRWLRSLVYENIFFSLNGGQQVAHGIVERRRREVAKFGDSVWQFRATLEESSS